MREKVLVAMSGGVDSSAAAILLQKEGFECSGSRLQLLEKEECPLAKDVEDAKRVCDQLQIPFFEMKEEEAFSNTVKKLFIEGYQQGRTPNPCIDCNREIKFGLFLERARQQGFDYIATGHYARVEKGENDKYVLLRGKDRKKDQSYMLYQLTQEQLAHVLLPIGNYSKEEIRGIVSDVSIDVAHKEDSQDICFIQDGDYPNFLKKQGVQLVPGDYLDKEGNVLGKHQGFQCYTMGQGKGLGIALGKHVYVIDKNPQNNTVTLGDNEDLFSTQLVAKEVNWIAGEVLEQSIRCTAKTRYSQKETACTVQPVQEGVLVTFEEPIRAITTGQAIVFYDEELVLGGGTIEQVM